MPRVASGHVHGFLDDLPLLAISRYSFNVSSTAILIRFLSSYASVSTAVGECS